MKRRSIVMIMLVSMGLMIGCTPKEEHIPMDEQKEVFKGWEKGVMRNIEMMHPFQLGSGLK